MKIVDNPYKKEFVFDLYSRIYPKFKEYDKITRKKMLEKIIEFYSDYNNIIDMCTYREIKFLKRMANREEINYDDERFKFEKASLIKKMLVGYNEIYEYDFYDELFMAGAYIALYCICVSDAKHDRRFRCGFFFLGKRRHFDAENARDALLLERHDAACRKKRADRKNCPCAFPVSPASFSRNQK